MTPKDFRAELTKIMPGYAWTVHKTSSETYLKATGTQSSGFNRLSTLCVVRTERDGVASYEAKSAGYGLRARWLHTHVDGTLARALRGLQDHYEAVSNTYRSHAASLVTGRKAVEVSA
jgi:Ca2+-dependent lipid-binding protein